MNEGFEQPTSQADRVAQDREKLDGETMWMRHGAEELSFAQVDGMINFENASRALMRTFAKAGALGTGFNAMSAEEQSTLARRLVTESDHMERAIADGAEPEWVQATILKAGLSMSDAMEAMRKAQSFIESNQG